MTVNPTPPPLAAHIRWGCQKTLTQQLSYYANVQPVVLRLVIFTPPKGPKVQAPATSESDCRFVAAPQPFHVCLKRP